MLRTRRPLLALLALLTLLAGGYLLSAVRADPAPTRQPAPASAAASGALPTVAASALPAEARRTLQLIDRGGPFPYEQDGSVFGNVARLLPVRATGWYREYTVPTPGEPDRGPRRIVAGRDGSRYFTADHYASFAVVAGA